MKCNQIEVGVNGDGEIVLRQKKKDVFITPDQAGLVINEIKKIAKFLKQGKKDDKLTSKK